MSIVAYTGLPGSGKSYGVVENVVLPAIKQNRSIITNIPLLIDELETAGYSPNITFFDYDKYQNDEVIDLEKLANFLNDESFFGSIFILDEIQLILPSGLPVNKVPKFLNEFFTKHRHRVGQDGYTSEIIYITQNQSQISAFLRNLTELTFNTNKQGLIGLKNHYSVFAYQGIKNDTAKAYQKFRGKYKKSVYRFYQSHTENKSFDYTSGLEQIQDKRTTIFTKKFFIILILAILLFSYSSYRTMQFFLPAEKQKEVEVENNQQENQSLNSNLTSSKSSNAELENIKITTKEKLENAFGPGTLYIELITTKLGDFSFYYLNHAKEKIYIAQNSISAFADKVYFLDICLAKTIDDYVITCPPAPKSQLKTKQSDQSIYQQPAFEQNVANEIIEPYNPFK